MERSHRWALRSIHTFNTTLNKNPPQALYGIIQGGVYEDLRKRSSDFTNSQDSLFGQAIGGSLGESRAQMHEIVAYTASCLHKDRPTHLLGIGGIGDIFFGVEQGIDTFDCVHPTRLARHGGALVRPCHQEENKREHINLRNTCYTYDQRPLEPDCSCSTCHNVTRAYLHYLLKAGETIVHSLLMIHNVTFMNRMMEAIRTTLHHQPDQWNNLKEHWVNCDRA